MIPDPMAALGGRRVGVHLPLGASMVKAADRAREIGATTIQVFTDNPTAWKRRDGPPKVLPKFLARLAEHAIAPLNVHGAYLINLAGPLTSKQTSNLGEYQYTVFGCTTVGCTGSADDRPGFTAACGAVVFTTACGAVVVSSRSSAPPRVSHRAAPARAASAGWAAPCPGRR